MEQQVSPVQSPDFVDRRSSEGDAPGVERRQFRDGNRSSRPEVAEFAAAIDEYKIENRRRFIIVSLLTSAQCNRERSLSW